MGSREPAVAPPGSRGLIGVHDVQQTFAQRGVAEISEFFTATEFDRLRRHVDDKIRRGLFRSMEGDQQIEGAPCEYGDPAAEQLLRVKSPYLSGLLHLDLVPTYSYLRLYRVGDRLSPHRDRPACEITVSASLSADSQWPLQILADGQVLACCPPPQGAVAFRGHELLHWRDALSANVPSAHVLFHYVQRNGLFRTWAYDRRPRGTKAPPKSARC